MTASIDERTAARNAAIATTQQSQRRLARPEEYVYCKSEEKFIDLLDGTIHTEKAVDASIPQELWRVVVADVPDPTPQTAQEGATPRRGRPPGPARPRERLIPPSRDIMRVENDQFVEGILWSPGHPRIVHDLMANEGGLSEAPGRRLYNRYRAAPESKGSANLANAWVDHIKKLWPDPLEHDYFFDYCAHMVQFPEEKCNAAVVLSGTQGIGKDAALYPIRAAVGAWNCKGIDPDDLFSPYNPFVEALMLTIDEVRPSHDEFKSSAFYNMLKTLAAAPPDMLPVNDKYIRLRYVINVVRLFITTNDFMSMFIPDNDRRLFVMHSTIQQKWHEAEGKPEYFDWIFDWFDNKGGLGHVAAWLKARDLAAFSAKRPVPKTMGWHAVAATWAEPEDAVAATIERLGKPEIIFTSELLSDQFDYKDELAGLLKSPRKLGLRMQRAGYVARTPPGGEDRWVFKSNEKTIKPRCVYVRQELLYNQDSLLEKIKKHGNIVVAKVASDNVFALKKDKF